MTTETEKAGALIAPIGRGAPPLTGTYSSPVIESIHQAAISGQKIRAYAAEPEGATRNLIAACIAAAAGDRKTRIHSDSGDVTIISETDRAETALTIRQGGLDRLSPALSPIFNFILEKAGEQAFIDKGGEELQLQRPYIDLPLRELVDRGAYTTIRAASVAVDAVYNLLTSISVSYRYSYCADDTETEKDISLPLFVGRQTEIAKTISTGRELRGHTKLLLNPQIPPAAWRQILAFYFKLPAFYYSLPTKAAELLLYVCVRARQDPKKATGDTFKIMAGSIVKRLALPATSRRFTQLVISPIDEAITAIHREQERQGLDLIHIEHIYPTAAKWLHYKRDGYITVAFRGVMREAYTGIGRSRKRNKSVKKITK